MKKSFIVYKKNYNTNTKYCVGFCTSEKRAKRYCDIQNKLKAGENVIYYYMNCFEITEKEVQDYEDILK